MSNRSFVVTATATGRCVLIGMLIVMFAGQACALSESTGGVMPVPPASREMDCRSRGDFNLCPGEQKEWVIEVDPSQSRVSIGIMWVGGKADIALFEPDGRKVVVVASSAGKEWLTDDPQVAFQGGDGHANYLLAPPVPGIWTVLLDGRAMTEPASVTMHVYTSSIWRIDAVLPSQVLAGEPFSLEARVDAWAPMGIEEWIRTFLLHPLETPFYPYAHKELKSPRVWVEFRQKGKNTASSKFQRVDLESIGPGGFVAQGVSFRGSHVLPEDWTGHLDWTFVLEALDPEGYKVHRESGGDRLVRGKTCALEPRGPTGVIAEPLPLIQVMVPETPEHLHVRLDGVNLRFVYDQETHILNARSIEPLASGGHEVFVEAHSRARDYVPARWTFSTGPFAEALDPRGDALGDGSFDLLSFRIGHDASASKAAQAGKEEVSFSVSLARIPTDCRLLDALVDIYIDTDGVPGSGKMELLPNRNAVLAPRDAWEYVLTISRRGAVLQDARGKKTSVRLGCYSGKILTVSMPIASLGLENPWSVGDFGYAVLVMGNEGQDGGGTRTAGTRTDPKPGCGMASGCACSNVVDLLALNADDQKAMLACPGAGAGARAALSAYRFRGGLQDKMPPLIGESKPSGAYRTWPESLSSVISDDQGVDARSVALAVDGEVIDPTLFAVKGPARRMTLSMALPPRHAGKHVFAVSAADLSGNRASSSTIFVLGPAAQLVRIAGKDKVDGMVIGADAVSKAQRLETVTLLRSVPMGIDGSRSPANPRVWLKGSWPTFPSTSSLTVPTGCS